MAVCLAGCDGCKAFLIHNPIRNALVVRSILQYRQFLSFFLCELLSDF